MKIGILTYHRAHNYGAVLQAFALKSSLVLQGHNVEFIDYWPDYRKGMYDFVDFSFFYEHMKTHQKFRELIKELIIFPKKVVRYTRFQKFIKQKLNVSKSSLVRDGSLIKDEYDVIIFGSDQIWRNNNFKAFKGFDSVYWGEFPKNYHVKKVAYAASMGVMHINTAQDKFIEDHLKNFNAISVRESKLFFLIQSLTNKKIEKVLDPVFLLDSKEWLNLLSENHSAKKDSKKEDYVLFYHLNNSPGAKVLTKRLSKLYKCKIIEIRGSARPFSFNFYETIGPEKYIWLMANAKVIVSTSFHGVAFSIIFRKQFYALGMRNNSERVTSLLKSLDISDRYIDDLKTLKNINIPIDYEKVDEKLSCLIKTSKNFLSNIL